MGHFHSAEDHNLNHALREPTSALMKNSVVSSDTSDDNSPMSSLGLDERAVLLLHPLELGSGAVDHPQPDGSTASVDEERISSETLSHGYVNKVLPTASASDALRLRDLEMLVDHG